MRQVYPLRSEVQLAVTGALIVRYRANWQLGEDYVAGDLVINSGSWFAIADGEASAANEPGVGASHLDYWVPLQHVTVSEATNFKAQDTIPYVKLVDGSSNDIAVKLDAGVLKITDNVALVDLLTIQKATGQLSLAAASAKADYQYPVDIANGVSTIGTTGAWVAAWTLLEGVSDNLQRIVRTVAAQDNYLRFPLHMGKRTATGKGVKLQSFTMSYTISGTVDATNDALQLQVIKQVIQADGTIPVSTILAGDDNADYDASHNTTANRLAVGNHTLVMTIPVAEQAFMADNEVYSVRVRMKDNNITSPSNITFTLYNIIANCTVAEY